ncbi:DUF2956 domain-containing protein [Echinimonas agarilytica]|uniref:DUF2956 domain-containing protein n=1 Tax=Echinimonas agarilytica TaxID=1215918 RepID=A0AA42B966_9GAMM|nr:DUF2956 domain-containing protein [Echinimonas agarilytica]MCM2681248.1 DUF2956 domain-containing protein [Echinimonas agarilytica]
MSKSISPETKSEAMQAAKSTQRPGQTKEQTKLIAQGIEKGIAEYKKQHKAKARQRDKQRKQHKGLEQAVTVEHAKASVVVSPEASKNWVPWALLVLSWLGFLAYYFSLV